MEIRLIRVPAKGWLVRSLRDPEQREGVREREKKREELLVHLGGHCGDVRESEKKEG